MVRDIKLLGNQYLHIEWNLKLVGSGIFDVYDLVYDFVPCLYLIIQAIDILTERVKVFL